MAELSYVATLEDLGLVKAREVIVSDSSQVGTMCVVEVDLSQYYLCDQINNHFVNV